MWWKRRENSSMFYLGFLWKMYVQDLSISCVKTPSSKPHALWLNPTVAVITLLSLSYLDFSEQEYKGARGLCCSRYYKCITYINYLINLINYLYYQCRAAVLIHIATFGNIFSYISNVWFGNMVVCLFLNLRTRKQFCWPNFITVVYNE